MMHCSRRKWSTVLSSTNEFFFSHPPSTLSTTTDIKMKKIYLFLLCLMSIVIPAGAQTPLEGKERDEALLRILSGYTPWSTVELNGKLQIPNMPMGIKPSVKIWMKRGERVMLSLRAPLMGEVGRAEIDEDSIMVVNKMKNTYCKEATGALLQGFPVSLNDLQSLLLARVFLLAKGELAVEDSPLVTLLKANDGSLMVVPAQSEQPEGAEYGFLTRGDGKLLALLVNIFGNEMPLTVIYDYTIAGGHELEAALPGNGMGQASLSFEKPLWGAAPFAGFTPDKRCRRMTLRDFMRSF